jgi:hypothetical protein
MAITKKQLEEQNAALRKENESLHRQIDARVEESDAYKALKKQIADVSSTKDNYSRQAEHWKTQYFDLQAKINQKVYKLQDEEAAEELQENEPLPDNVRNDEDEDDEPIDEESEELIENIVAYLKEAYANENKSISNTRAKANVRYWRKTAEGRKQFDILIEYFEGRLSATKRQMQAQNEKIQDLELQAKDRESTKQFNATMGNYAALSELSKQLKAKQVELDASVTAQNALKSDLDKLAAKYMQATQHNARNAGRKPKLTADQEQEIKNLRSEGLNVRQIAAKMSCSTGLVCKILKN